jgi:hypothetical protein
MATESLGFDRIRRRSKRGEFDGYEIALVDLLKQDIGNVVHLMGALARALTASAPRSRPRVIRPRSGVG